MSYNELPDNHFERPEHKKERAGCLPLKLFLVLAIALLLSYAVYTSMKKPSPGKGQETVRESGTATQQLPGLTLLRKGGPLYTLRKTETGWTLSSSSQTMELRKTDRGYESEGHRISIKDNKVYIKTRDGRRILKVKDKVERINIYQGDEEDKTWALKRKDGGNISVKELGNTIGKISFDSGVTRAEDSSGTVICMLEHNTFTMAPAICLLDGLDEEQSMLLFFVLNTMGQ